MPDRNKALAGLFGGFLQGLGRKKYQSYLDAEKERLGEKAIKAKRDDELYSTALQNFLNPDLPWAERVQWGKIYEQGNGQKLPTIWPGPAEATQAQPQAQPELGYIKEKQAAATDPLGLGNIAQQQDFLQRSAERQKTLMEAESAKSLARKRTIETQPKPAGDNGKLDLDKLKLQFQQLNIQYDDLSKLIPRDIYGNPLINQDDPRIKELQRLDTERNRVYNTIYGGKKKPIPW